MYLTERQGGGNCLPVIVYWLFFLRVSHPLAPVGGLARARGRCRPLQGALRPRQLASWPSAVSRLPSPNSSARALRVLHQPPIAHLPVSEQPFHPQERVLYLPPSPTPSPSLPRPPDSQGPVAAADPDASPPSIPPPDPGSPPACVLPDIPHHPTPPSPRRAADCGSP